MTVQSSADKNKPVADTPMDSVEGDSRDGISSVASIFGFTDEQFEQLFEGNSLDSFQSDPSIFGLTGEKSEQHNFILPSHSSAEEAKAITESELPAIGREEEVLSLSSAEEVPCIGSDRLFPKANGSLNFFRRTLDPAQVNQVTDEHSYAINRTR